MSRHKHLILDFEEGEIIGLALPAEGAIPGPSLDARIREELIGTINGINKVFNSSQYIDRSVVGKEEYLAI